MPLKPQIDAYYKSNRGINPSINESVNWFNDAKRSSTNTSVQTLNLSDEFHKGKVYRFSYDATTEGLKYFDRNPLIISLGRSHFKNSICETGLNLNLLPYVVKINFLSKMYNSYENLINREINGRNANNAKAQKPLSFTRDNIMRLIKYYNAGYAVRNYLSKNRTDTTMISYDNWYRAAFIQEFDFEGFTINKIYNDYYSYMRNKKRNR